jgi:hypothetical protein
MDFHAISEKTFDEALRQLPGPLWTEKDFCHYTTLQGLVGIVENNELWLSDHRFLNDKLEYEYGRQLAISVISEMAEMDSTSDFSKFLQSVLASIQKPSNQAFYVGSMSFTPDKLDQWKGYGNSRESVCIKFAGNYELWNTGNSHPSHIQQHRIIYDEFEQKNIIRNIVDIFRTNFNEFRQHSFPFINEISWLIESRFILFKHPDYASEDELRLTIANLTHILKIKKPKHRVAKEMVIPYISTKYISNDSNPALNLLPIKEIIVSPTSSSDLLDSVRAFVANIDRDIRVVESRIKFRG